MEILDEILKNYIILFILLISFGIKACDVSTKDSIMIMNQKHQMISY